jgi:Tfp pilus assembly protein PilF
MVLLNEHEITQAQSVFQTALNRTVTTKPNSRLLLGAALCEVRMGKDSDARLLFEESVNSDNTHAHAWQAWGILEVKGGNYEVARELFEVGLVNCKNHAALWQALARMEESLGNVREARKLFKVGYFNCRRR